MEPPLPSASAEEEVTRTRSTLLDETTEQWMSRVQERQSSKASPELLERMKKKAEETKQRDRRIKSCTRMQKSNVVSMMAWNSASTDMMAVTRSPMRTEERHSRMQDINTRSSAAMMTLQRSPAYAPEAPEDVESEVALDQLFEGFGIQQNDTPIEVLEVTGQTQMRELLNDLRVEPADEVEQGKGKQQLCHDR